MNNISKFLALTAILGLFLITGCGEEDTTDMAQSPYIGGTKGVVAEFEPMGIEENGVYTIYADETFPLQIILKNKGEESVNVGQATVTIKGVYLGDLSGVKGEKLSNTEEIEPISTVNKEGGEIIVDFGSSVKYTPSITGDFVPLDILASYVYKYKTKTSVPKVCFKEDLSDKELCSVDEIKTHYSSAAPIQVNSVKESPAGAGKVSIAFEIENIGGGSATIPGTEFNTRYDQMKYKILPETEAAKWKCTAAGRENEARFADKVATIICKLNNPLSTGDKYTKEIVLEMEYEYRDVIQESLRIKKP